LNPRLFRSLDKVIDSAVRAGTPRGHSAIQDRFATREPPQVGSEAIEFSLDLGELLRIDHGGLNF
jgi:hypothetical protein